MILTENLLAKKAETLSMQQHLVTAQLKCPWIKQNIYQLSTSTFQCNMATTVKLANVWKAGAPCSFSQCFWSRAFPNKARALAGLLTQHKPIFGQPNYRCPYNTRGRRCWLTPCSFLFREFYRMQKSCSSTIINWITDSSCTKNDKQKRDRAVWE
jgi:hypothetical protein